MSRVLQKFLRKPLNSSFPTISSLQKPLLSLTPNLIHPLTNPDFKFRPNPAPNPPTDEQIFVYPSFSFGHFLNPLSASGFYQSMPQVSDSEDSQMIWADSVKKKRKKKMNKHKLKKLKKRLRHCS